MRYRLRYPVPHRRSLDYAETWLSANSASQWSIRFGGFMVARDQHGRRVQALSLTVLFEQAADRRRFAIDYLGIPLSDNADDNLTFEKLCATEASPAATPAEPPVIDAPIRTAAPLRRENPPVIAPGNKKIIDIKT